MSDLPPTVPAAAEPGAAPAALPTADDVLGPAPKPTTDDILGPAGPPPTAGSLAFGGGRLLHYYGLGFSQQWGAAPLGVSPDTEKWMRQAGVWNDYQAGHTSFWRTLNEAIMRPAAVAADAVSRGLAGAFYGGPKGIAEAPTAPDIEGRLIQYGAAALIIREEAFPTGLPFPFIAAPRVPAQVAEARDLNVIGSGEAGWKGGAEAAPDAATADADAIKAQPPAEEPEAMAPETAAPPPPPPDLHAVARQIAPDTFAEYDALAVRKDNFRQWIGDLAEQRARGSSPAIDALDAEIDQLRGARLEGPAADRGRIANRVIALENQRAKLVDELPTEGDTPEMATVRRDMMAADERMRDLAPQVSAAYRQAAEQGGAEIAPAAAPAAPPVAEEAPAAVPVPPTEEAAAAPAEAVSTAAAAPTAEAPGLPLPAPALQGGIAGDVARQLTAAGRPAEEAGAAAALVQAHYEARASRLAGATPEELYAADAPNIVASRRQRAAAPEYAQKPQPGELEQVRRGKIRLAADDAKATITLFRDADASTFIHETGHQWLEELVKDAGDERATEGVRSDAATVRDWLGVGEGEDIPTKAHEKFARGFERYMMEGHAPSQALAGVFAKFKDWLTRIYQTVASLRAPISDDIRRVFDRMLAANPERTVIAPERETAASFADMHEADAEHVAPEHAIQTADLIEAERDRVAEHAPDDIIAGRRDSRAAAEAGRAQPGNQLPDRGGNAGQSEPAGSGNGAQPGTLGAGGSEAAPQGPGVSAEPAAAGAGTGQRGGSTAATEPPASPNARFAPAEGRLIDRAGNIRLDNLNQPEEVNQVLRETAERNNGFLTARRGVLSDAEVLDLADALGMRPADLDARKIGQAFNAEEVTAARNLAVQSASAVHDAATKAGEAGASDADVMAYAEAKARHAMIQEQVSGITAEAGRALRAFRAIEGSKEAEAIGQFLNDATEGKTLYQLRREARALSQLATPAQVSKAVLDSRKPGLFDWIQSAFINALISNPATHGTYTVANQVLAWYKATAETAASALIGQVRVALGASEADRVRLAEAQGQVFGILNGYRNGGRAAWGAMKANETMPLPGEKLANKVSYGRSIPNPEVAGRTIPIGTALELPSRGVTGLHAFSRTVGYSRSISGQAYRIAANEGLDWQSNAFAARVADLVQNPTEAMMKEAVGEANEDAMMQTAKFGSYTQKFATLTNQGIPLPDVPLPGGRSLPLGTLRPIKFIEPFAVISSNIVNATLGRRSVMGLLSEEMRADLSGANGGVALDKAAGRLLAGTATMLAFGGLAAEALLTGPRPSDPRDAARLRQGGWQPNAVKIGEHYFSLHGLGVVGMMASVAAGMWHAGASAASGDMATAGSLAIHAFAQSILDESPMRGVSELLQAIEDPDRYGPSYVRQLLPSFAPYSMALGQAARIVDPSMREARSLTEAMLQHIPWASETLHPRIDVWGQPIPNRDQLVPGLLSIYQTRINNDPVQQAYDRLGFFPGPIERKVVGVELTEGQYETLARTAGRMAKMQLDRIVAQPDFARMPDFVQREIMTKTVDGARRVARELLKMQNPSIVGAAIAEKKALIHGATPAQGRQMLKEQSPAAVH